MIINIIVNILVGIIIFLMVYGIVYIVIMPIPKEIIRSIKFKKISRKFNLRYRSVNLFPNLGEIGDNMDVYNTARKSSGVINNKNIEIRDVLEFGRKNNQLSNFRELVRGFYDYRKYYTLFIIDNIEQSVSKNGYAKISEIENWLKSMNE